MENNYRPLVTILMAVYNTEEFISEAIDSVLAQTYSNWEMICVDDGSTDRSLQKLNKYKSIDARITVLQQHRSGTASGARNTGLKAAKGDFIVVLDSDDKLEDQYLNKILNKFQLTKADMIISAIHFWDYKQNRLNNVIIGIDGDLSPIISGKDAFLLSLQWKIGGLGLYKTKILRAIGGYDTNGMNADEFTTRLLFLNSDKVAFSDASYYYRNNISSSTKKFSVKHFEKNRTNYRIFQLLKEKQFDLKLVKLEKLKLYKSFLFSYFTLVSIEDQLTKDEFTYAKTLLLQDTSALKDELQKHPKLNKSESLYYKIVLLSWGTTVTFTIFRVIRLKLKGFTKALIKLYSDHK